MTMPPRLDLTPLAMRGWYEAARPPTSGDGLSRVVNFAVRRHSRACTMTAVSFIITVYNKRPHLPAVLSGLAEQDGLDSAEFLFIDDGSTDGSLAAIENALAEAVRFFHIDALSSSVGLKVDFDMALLVLASGLYRLIGRRMRGYHDAQARQIFRDLIDTDIAILEPRIKLIVENHNNRGIKACAIDCDVSGYAGYSTKALLGN